MRSYCLLSFFFLCCTYRVIHEERERLFSHTTTSFFNFKLFVPPVRAWSVQGSICYVQTHFGKTSAAHFLTLRLGSPWQLSSETSEGSGVCSIKVRPHLICHLLYCKYTLRVHTACRSPRTLRATVLSANAAEHILGSSRMSVLEPL